jgi:hypothetical protein
MEQTDTIYNDIYDAPNTEFKLNEDGKKHCFKCKHYGCLVNQGYWWCNLQLNMDDQENCEEYDGSLYDNAVTTYSSSYTITEQKPKGGMTPKQYGEMLMKKAKRKRTR